MAVYISQNEPQDAACLHHHGQPGRAEIPGITLLGVSADLGVPLHHNATGRGNKLTLLPGHCGIAGNEKADELSKIASRLTFAGPEPFTGS